MNEIRVTGTSGMIVKGENRNTPQKESYSSASVSAQKIMQSFPAAVRMLYELELLTSFLRFSE
jgi:hypothetical protein